VKPRPSTCIGVMQIYVVNNFCSILWSAFTVCILGEWSYAIIYTYSILPVTQRETTPLYLQVWCCTISNDNELVASGSRDRTIRLWRSTDGHQVAAINAGVDVFRVLLSNNKQTVVALADKMAARKLIMLQIVRSKTKSVSDAASRATTPAATPLTPSFQHQFWPWRPCCLSHALLSSTPFHLEKINFGSGIGLRRRTSKRYEVDTGPRLVARNQETTLLWTERI